MSLKAESSLAICSKIERSLFSHGHHRYTGVQLGVSRVRTPGAADATSVPMRPRAGRASHRGATAGPGTTESLGVRSVERLDSRGDPRRRIGAAVAERSPRAHTPGASRE